MVKKLSMSKCTKKLSKTLQIKQSMHMEITKAGFCDLELVAVCTGVAISGGNRFTAYIYKRLLPV